MRELLTIGVVGAAFVAGLCFAVHGTFNSCPYCGKPLHSNATIKNGLKFCTDCGYIYPREISDEEDRDSD